MSAILHACADCSLQDADTLPEIADVLRKRAKFAAMNACRFVVRSLAPFRRGQAVRLITTSNTLNMPLKVRVRSSQLSGIRQNMFIYHAITLLCAPD